MLKAITTFALLVFSSVCIANQLTPDKLKCQSPLYVSGVNIADKSSPASSLINYFAYFDIEYQDGGQKHGMMKNTQTGALNIARKQVTNNESFVTRDASAAFDLYVSSILRQEPSIRTPQSLSEMFKTYRLLHGKYRNTADLVEAVRIYELDPQLNLTQQLGVHLSLIDHVIHTSPVDKQLDYVEQLINVGVPVTSDAIRSAITARSAQLLSLLLAHFDENAPEHRIQTSFDKRFDKFSFVDYAVEVGNIEGLALILESNIGNRDRALETLLTSYSRNVNLENPDAFAQLIERYTSKLELLLNSGLSAPSNILLDTSAKLQPVLGKLTERLIDLAKTPESKAAGILEQQVTKEADDYLVELISATNRWPFFIFSYDKNCEKVPHDSHYRLDNIASQSEFKKWITANQSKKPKQFNALLAAKGDIYVDWYADIVRQQADNKNTSKRYYGNKKLMRKIYDYIEQGKWFEINSLMMSQDIEADDLAILRNEVLHLGLIMNAPQHITDGWFEEGVIIEDELLSKLIAEHEYVHTVVSKLEKNLTILSTEKSALYQASEAKNLQLVEALLQSKKLDKKYKTDKGMSALTWTLLNYTPDLKPQLQLLLKQQKNQLTALQHLLVKSNTID